MKIWTWESIFPKQRERCSSCFIVVKLLNMNFMLILEKNRSIRTLYSIYLAFWLNIFGVCVLPLATLDFLRIRIVKVYVRSVWFSLCACTVCGTGLYCAIVLENFNFLNLPCIASAIYFAVWWLFGGIMDKYYCMYKTKTYQSIPPLANSRYSSKQTIRVGLVI